MHIIAAARVLSPGPSLADDFSRCAIHKRRTANRQAARCLDDFAANSARKHKLSPDLPAAVLKKSVSFVMPFLPNLRHSQHYNSPHRCSTWAYYPVIEIAMELVGTSAKLYSKS
jgi:hypothetical protein